MPDSPDDFFGFTFWEKAEPLILAAIGFCALLGMFRISPFYEILEAANMWLHSLGTSK